MKKKHVIMLLAAAAVTVTGWQVYSRSTAEPEPVETVKEVKAATGDLVIDFLSDGIVAMDTWPVGFAASGTISGIHVEEGSRVTEGALLATLDTSELALMASRTESALAAEREKIRQEALDEANALAQEAENLKALEASLALEQETLSAMEQLSDIYTLNEIRQQQYKVDDLLSRIAQQQLKIDGLDKATASADALALETLGNDLALIRMDMDKADLYAPISGTVVELSAVEGTLASPGGTLLVIQDTDSPYVVAQVSEMDIHQVEEGQKVYVSFESDYGVPYTGYVASISPLPSIDNNGIVSYETAIRLESRPGSIRSGLTVMLSFVLKERLDAVIIPNEAVLLQGTGQFVEVKTAEGSEMRPVMTGLTDGMEVEVLEGLEAGDILLVRSYE